MSALAEVRRASRCEGALTVRWPAPFGMDEKGLYRTTEGEKAKVVQIAQ